MSDNKIEFNGETHEIPMGLMARVGGDITLEEARSQYTETLKSLMGGNEEPPANSEQPSGQPNTDAPPANGEPPVTPPSTDAWFKKFLEVDTEEDAAKTLEELKGYKKTVDTIKAKESFWNQVENPFAEERDVKINQFKKLTGITGRRGEELADAIVLSDLEDIKKDPLKAIAVARATDNPNRLKDFSLDDLVGKVKREAEKAGVNFEDENYKESPEWKDFVMDSMDSVEKIEKYREKFGNYQNPFENLQKTREAAVKSLEAKLPEIKSEISNLGLTQVTRKIGDVEVSLDAPKDILKSIPEVTLKDFAASHDLKTKEGKEAFRADVEAYVLVKMLETGELEKSVWSKAFTAGQESVEKTQFNGQPRVIDRGGKSGGDQPVSDIQNRVNKAWNIPN